ENSARRDQYASLRGRLYDKKVKKDAFELGPEAVTAKLIHAIEAYRPKARYYVTTPTYLMGFARRILPTRMLDWLIAKG
nr:short-chain dehydrogenase [Tabrizicola sp.]